jgi:hypothetical protein
MAKFLKFCLLFIVTRLKDGFPMCSDVVTTALSNPRDQMSILWSHRRWIIYAVVSCRKACIHECFMAGMRSTEFCTTMLTY